MRSGAATWSAYYTPHPDLDDLGLVCLGVGGQRGQVRPVRDRVLDHHALVIVDGGTGWYADDDGRRPVRARSMIGVVPGVRHSYGPDADGWSEQWVLLRGRSLAVHTALGLLPREPVALVDRPDAVLRAFARLRAGRDAATPADHVRRSADCTVLLLAVAPDGTSSSAVDRLTREPDGAASVRDHARALGTSEAQLRALVLSSTGATPKSLVLRGRVDRAKALLAETSLPVARVAVRVGYEDPAYFARLFRRVVGVTPTTFRTRYLRVGEET